MSNQLSTVAHLARPSLQKLFHILRGDGYRLIGPTVQDDAIVYDDIATIDDLPVGITDRQGPGSYRLEQRTDDALFGFAVGPRAWKRYLFPPQEPLVAVRRNRDTPSWTACAPNAEQVAFIGVRACDLHAIAIQDQVFLAGPFVDPQYRARRDACLIVAVDCTEAGDLCFCTSMQAGPRVEGNYDLRLTEIDGAFVVRAGSDAGRALIDRLPVTNCSPQLEAQAEAAVDSCRLSMKRQLDTAHLPQRLYSNLDHPRWQSVGQRCLSCGNCTLVCPTCFCFNVADDSPISSAEDTRTRAWDSCFTQDHSTIHGSQFRPDTAARYRQWVTHKFASWTSQFGTSGCVGCGRCIAWCPVGIDVIEETTAIATPTRKPVALPAPRDYEFKSDTAMVPTAVRVRDVIRETHDTVTIRLDRPDNFSSAPGQFNMLSLPGIGDIPISIAGLDLSTIDHTIRQVGAVSGAMCQLEPGSWLGLRGPFGSSWPMDALKHEQVVIIAGGIGVAPLRQAMRHMANHFALYPNVRLLYGTRSPADIIYDRELLSWMQCPNINAHVTVDRSAHQWMGNVGAVTSLMRKKHIPKRGRYLLCGPEVMMQFVLAQLIEIGVAKSQIYLSMERNMKCAAGLCGRCQYGPYFVCKDGPVFRYDQIDFLFGTPGF